MIGAARFAPCPECGDADLEPRGGKDVCPRCGYVAPCCDLTGGVPADLRYRGSSTPPAWFRALQAILALRVPPRLTTHDGRRGYTEALHDIRHVVLRELGDR